MGVEFSYQVRGEGGKGEGKEEEGRGRRAWREGTGVCEGRCYG